MTERKTVRRWIWAWDFEMEEAWLNEMAMNGWTLCEVHFCTYTFEKTEPGEYIVRLEMHPEDQESYCAFLKESGAEYIGHVVQWLYFRKKAEEGSFDLFSDIDSRIEHLNRISRLLSIIGTANLIIGICNSVNVSHLGWINLLCATLLMYGLGRIHGKKEALEKERLLHE